MSWAFFHQMVNQVLYYFGHALLDCKGGKNIFPFVFQLCTNFLKIFPQKAENDPWLRFGLKMEIFGHWWL